MLVEDEQPASRIGYPDGGGVAAPGRGCRRALFGTVALILALIGCGPGVAAAEAEGEGADASSGATATDTASADATSEVDTTGGHVCADTRYCFERYDLRELRDPDSAAAADLDADGRDDLLVRYSLERNAAILGWSEGPLLSAVTEEAGCDYRLQRMRVGATSAELLVSVVASPNAMVSACRRIDDQIGLVSEPMIEPEDGILATFRAFDVLDVEGDGVDEVVAAGVPDMPLYHRPWVMRRADDGWHVDTSFPDLLWLNGQGLAVGDVDGDGLGELVTVDSQVSWDDPDMPFTDYDPDVDQVVVLDPQDGYAERWRAPAATLSRELHLEDYDDDGHLDMLLDGDGESAVAWGTGDGGFTEPALFEGCVYAPTPNDLECRALGDFDGDGHTDALVVSPAFDDGFVIVADPFGAGELHEIPMSNRSSFDNATRQAAIAIFDLDADGRDDLLFVARDDGDDHEYPAILKSVIVH
ncbi:MAG TPA: VCBS repeat-containing protein [Nannocystaceae bacterium]|nr:VCBS repeat-containing protein [Nannocystaceae bacterium]